MITADEIQFHYPNPSNDATDGTYCVGGALCRYMGLPPSGYGSFPHVLNLARALRQANPDLLFDDSQDFARRIISKNDSGNFDEAWLALREALKWEPEDATKVDF